MIWTKPILIALGKQNPNSAAIDMLKIGYANLMIDGEFFKAGVIFRMAYQMIRW